MKNWEAIRAARTDLTDFVIHFTRDRVFDDDGKLLAERRTALDVLQEILRDGYIRPTFAKMTSRNCSTPSPTIRGPHPAVCLTEQTPEQFIAYRQAIGASRYAAYGIAYKKWALYAAGARPVLYADISEIGRSLGPDDEGYESGKDVRFGPLPPALQYLWVRYHPADAQTTYPVDFTWEREWRHKPSAGEAGLPVVLRFDNATPAAGRIIVAKDADVSTIRQTLADLQATPWNGGAHRLTRIVSLETVATQLTAGDRRYARLETCPDMP